MNAHLDSPPHILSAAPPTRFLARVSSARTAAAVSLSTVIIGVTVLAASFAWFLGAVARLPEQAVVITVMIVAFTCSSIVTNRSCWDGCRPTRHRVTMVPVRGRCS